MVGLRAIEGDIAPLFDRLRIARSAAEPQALQNLDRAALQESVCRELTSLFSVRSPTAPARYGEAELTTLDYGVPDFTAFSPQVGEDRQRLAQLLERAVTAFEPRLKEVVAAVEAVPNAPEALLVRLKGTLRAGRLVVPIALTVATNGQWEKDRTVEVQVVEPVGLPATQAVDMASLRTQ